MAAPTFVADYESVWNSTADPKTAEVTTAVGDVLAILCAGENGGADMTGLPTGGTPTYVNQEWTVVGGGDAEVRLDTAVTGITAQTFTLNRTSGGTVEWFGFDCLRFSGSDGIGAAESVVADSGAAEIGITTTQDNSAIAVIISDWNAIDAGTRTWLTVNGYTPSAGNGQELVYFRDGVHYSVLVAYYPDAGAAGSKTVGLSVPASGMAYSIAAVEIKGTAGTEVDITALPATAVGLVLPPGLEVVRGKITGRAISYQFPDHQIVIESGR